MVKQQKEESGLIRKTDQKQGNVSEEVAFISVITPPKGDRIH